MHTTYNYFTTLHFHPFPQLCCYVILFFLEKIIYEASNAFYRITTLKVGYKHRYGLNFADSFPYNLKVFGRIYFQADCKFLNLRQQMVIKCKNMSTINSMLHLISFLNIVILEDKQYECII